MDLTTGWARLDSRARRALAGEIAERSEGRLEVVRSDEVAVFSHSPSGVLFHLVPGGSIQMGVDDADRDLLREQYQYRDECDEVEHCLALAQLRPATHVDVRGFLLAARPLSPEQLDSLVTGEQSPAGAKGRSVPDLKKAAKLPADQYVKHLARMSAGTFDDAQISELESLLEKVGLRLPSEAEWELAARGGTTRLFPHGNQIPDSPNLGANPYAFVDMGADAEVCADGWVDTLAGIPNDGTPRPPSAVRVSRGGAANCYPWQGCGEWTLLLCGWRGPSSQHEGFLTLRPALGL